jgi:hypothetical protein
MPYEDADPQDPMLLVGVELPGSAEQQREMAAVFAEEFARMGFDEERILRLFSNPVYTAAHRALNDLGEEEVRALVREACEVWGRVRIVDREGPPAPAWAPLTFRNGGGL